MRSLSAIFISGSKATSVFLKRRYFSIADLILPSGVRLGKMEGPVEYVFFANRLRRRAFADVSATVIRAGRLLVLLTGLLLAVMPFTEGLWIWDKFLLGGQDMELGLLGIA